jgi:hypothetical protein
MRYHPTPIRMAAIKKQETKTTKQKITSVAVNVVTLEPLCNVSGSVKWYSCYGKCYGGS